MLEHCRIPEKCCNRNASNDYSVRSDLFPKSNRLIKVFAIVLEFIMKFDELNDAIL